MITLKPEAFQTCIAKISAKGRVSEQQAAQLLQELANRSEDDRTEIMKAKASLLDQASRDFEDAKLNAAKHDNFITSRADLTSIRGAVDSLRALFNWTLGHKASKINIENTQERHFLELGGEYD